MAPLTTIYLLRHGEVEHAETRRFIGHLDVRLSALGEQQCRAQGARLCETPISALFTSDLVRARTSGEIVGAPHGLTPTALPALREMAMGRWEGLTAREIEEREPAAFAEWTRSIGEFPFPEGESVPELAARTWPVFEALARDHSGRTIAVVAHGGTNRAILCRALGLPLDRLLSFGQDYGGLNVLLHDPRGWRVARVNERPVL